VIIVSLSLITVSLSLRSDKFGDFHRYLAEAQQY
jgi:hypothetical protein